LPCARLIKWRNVTHGHAAVERNRRAAQLCDLGERQWAAIVEESWVSHGATLNEDRALRRRSPKTAEYSAFA